MAVKSKKKWIKITALKPFNEQYIGETFVEEIDKVIGKKVSLSLMDLTNDPKRQNIKIQFEITKKHKDGVAAEIVGYSLVPSSIRRMVRRNCNRIDESYVFKTKDNKKVKIKPLILTRSLTKGSVLKAIRKLVREFLSGALSNLDYEQLTNDLLNYKLQKDLRNHIKKTYPLKVCEIKVMKLEKPKKDFEPKEKAGKKEKAEEKTEEVKEEEEDKVEEKAEAKEEKKVKEESKEKTKKEE